VQYNIVQYRIVQYRIVQYILLQCSTMQYRTGTTGATAQVVTEMYQQLSMLALLPNDVITGSTGGEAALLPLRYHGWRRLIAA
jgi:hypothetical protein